MYILNALQQQIKRKTVAFTIQYYRSCKTCLYGNMNQLSMHQYFIYYMENIQRILQVVIKLFQQMSVLLKTYNTMQYVHGIVGGIWL